MMDKKVVAAFDFDGTLTYTDSLLPFLFQVVGFTRGFFYLFQLIPSFVLYFFNRLSRRQLKEKILTKYVRGIPIGILVEQGKDYASSFWLKKLIRAEALERLQWHQRQGHFCLLISANLDLYLRPWAKKMGCECLASQLQVDSSGFVTGCLQGENCRGKEKTKRLQEFLGQKENYVLYAYGDSDGDRELLAYADYPFYCTFK